ncbi:hypothetical protein [Pseudoalteromonas sp. S16_S37]|uniref:hypothetical protein n=1 Tax=Pseudoalteromonas sp. S16_S37 TaxID=2720228 RepID=UPI00168114BF|nr:hypothetical protein [Pseudoalteromonas sp. S16_S37]MBD1580873.1 hypothetical protein [Pseudoalteromonas sp. S16_S37]
MAIDLSARVILKTPSFEAAYVVASADDLLDTHTVNRHQAFFNNVYSGYLMRHRVADDQVELVYHHLTKATNQDQHIHNHISKNCTLINKHAYYQFNPMLVPNSHRQAKLVVKPNIDQQRELPKQASSFLPMVETMLEGKAAHQEKIFKPLQLLLQGKHDKIGRHFGALIQQPQRQNAPQRQGLRSEKVEPQKRVLLVEHPQDNRRLRNLSQRNHSLNNAHGRQQTPIMVSHPLIINTFNDRQQLQNTYQSKLLPKLWTDNFSINADTSSNNTSLANYQYSMQYHSLRQTMPYAISSAFAANMQTDLGNQSSSSQPLNYLHNWTQSGFNPQLHKAFFNELSLTSSQLKQSVAKLHSRSLVPAYQERYQKLWQGAARVEKTSFSSPLGMTNDGLHNRVDRAEDIAGEMLYRHLSSPQTQVLSSSEIIRVTGSIVKSALQKRQKHIEEQDSFNYKANQEHANSDISRIIVTKTPLHLGSQSSSIMAAGMFNKATFVEAPTKQLSRTAKDNSRATLVYTTTDKPTSSIGSSGTLPSTVSTSIDGTKWALNQSNAQVHNSMSTAKAEPPSVLTPEQQSPPFGQRSHSALSKSQTRQVADEVYQLINQRLRFEKRRRGLA